MILFNDVPIVFKQFPNGETLIDKPFFGINKDATKNVVTLRYESDADLLQLLLVKKSLWFPCTLEIYYFPYSRMDRNSQEYIFTLKSIAKFINWLDWKQVVIYEPHSDVTPALLNHCKVVSLVDKILAKTDFNLQEDFVLYPDAGAQKKYAEIIKAPNELIGWKIRDFATGKIKNLHIVGDNYAINSKENWALTGKRVFIIDDLCSKGGTFILAAEKLKEMGAGKINLVVAHCEETFYKGKIPRSEVIDHVYTTDSMPDYYFEGTIGKTKITRFPLKEIVDKNG